MDYKFKINGAPYHFEIISKKSKEWDVYSTPSRHPLKALLGLTSYSKSKGRVRYSIGRSIRVRHARFQETWLSDTDVSTRTLDLKLGMPAIRQIHLETYCNDSGGGGITKLFAKKRTGLFSWKSVPIKEVESNPLLF